MSWGSRKELINRCKPLHSFAPRRPAAPAALATVASFPHTLKEVCCDLHSVIEYIVAVDANSGSVATDWQ